VVFKFVSDNVQYAVIQCNWYTGTNWLTNYMEQRILKSFWEVHSHSACQELPHLAQNITLPYFVHSNLLLNFVVCKQSVQVPSHILLCVVHTSLYSEVLLTCCPISKPNNCIVLAACDSLFTIFTATLYMLSISTVLNLKISCAMVVRDSWNPLHIEASNMD